MLAQQHYIVSRSDSSEALQAGRNPSGFRLIEPTARREGGGQRLGMDSYRQVDLTERAEAS